VCPDMGAQWRDIYILSVASVHSRFDIGTNPRQDESIASLTMHCCLYILLISHNTSQLLAADGCDAFRATGFDRYSRRFTKHVTANFCNDSGLNGRGVFRWMESSRIATKDNTPQ